MHLPSVITFLFLTWAGLLVWKQVSGERVLKRCLDQCVRILLPSWGLFTSDLRRLDAFMYVRDFSNDGSTTAWRDVTPTGRNGQMALSFSDRRLVAAFTQSAKTLVYPMPLESPFVSDLDDTRSLMASRNYQALLYYARSQPASPRAERRQILIAVRPYARLSTMTAHSDLGFSVPNRIPRLVTGFHELSGRTPRVRGEPSTALITMQMDRETEAHLDTGTDGRAGADTPVGTPVEAARRGV